MHSNFNIASPDQGMAAALQHKIDQKTKPLGALGLLEKTAKKIGLIQQSLTPEFMQPYMLVFAGDHGAAKAGVSAFPQDVTWQMVENFLSGGAAINVFARQNDMHLAIIDAGVAHDFGKRAGLINAKVALGTANYLEQPAMTAEQCAQAIARGAEWTLGLQSRDGGFAAFDADNTAHYLNNLPFADHGALLDPPTADVSARVVSMLAQLGEPMDSPRMVAALDWLARAQEADGSWFGRWGVNYVYGTWSVLCALGRAGLDAGHPMVARAVDWLKRVQNADGGWGESCTSYALEREGHEAFGSTASQTAGAGLGRMAVGEARRDAVARGVAWLAQHQGDDGLWGQEPYTGGGFPRVFYLRYHGYPRYFPLWALARYRNLTQSNSERTPWGM